MWFLLKNTSWQSRKNNTYVCLHISWLTFLNSLFTLPSKVILHHFSHSQKIHKRSWKHALESCPKEQVWKVFADSAGVNTQSSWVPFQLWRPEHTWVWVHGFLSLFHPSTMPFNFFLLLYFLTRFLASAMIQLPGFWGPSSSQTQDKPNVRIGLSLWSPSNLRLSTPSLPGFPSQFLCQVHMSPPLRPPSDIPQSLGQLPTSPDPATHFITLCPYLLPSSQLKSHGSLLSYFLDWPQQGNTGAKGQCSGLLCAASLAGSRGKPPSSGKLSFCAQLQARPLPAALCSHDVNSTERLTPASCSCGFQSTCLNCGGLSWSGVQKISSPKPVTSLVFMGVLLGTGNELIMTGYALLTRESCSSRWCYG